MFRNHLHETWHSRQDFRLGGTSEWHSDLRTPRAVNVINIFILCLRIQQIHHHLVYRSTLRPESLRVHEVSSRDGKKIFPSFAGNCFAYIAAWVERRETRKPPLRDTLMSVSIWIWHHQLETCENVCKALLVISRRPRVLQKRVFGSKVHPEVIKRFLFPTLSLHI